MVLYKGTIFRVSYEIVTKIFVFPQTLPCLAGALPVIFGYAWYGCHHVWGLNKIMIFLQANITWTDDGQYVSPGLIELTHWGRDKMDAISQTILLKIFIE